LLILLGRIQLRLNKQKILAPRPELCKDTNGSDTADYDESLRYPKARNGAKAASDASCVAVWMEYSGPVRLAVP